MPITDSENLERLDLEKENEFDLLKFRGRRWSVGPKPYSESRFENADLNLVLQKRV